MRGIEAKCGADVSAERNERLECLRQAERPLQARAPLSQLLFCSYIRSHL
jgi:hypothetical protein